MSCPICRASNAVPHLEARQLTEVPWTQLIGVANSVTINPTPPLPSDVQLPHRARFGSMLRVSNPSRQGSKNAPVKWHGQSSGPPQPFTGQQTTHPLRAIKFSRSRKSGSWRKTSANFVSNGSSFSPTCATSRVARGGAQAVVNAVGVGHEVASDGELMNARFECGCDSVDPVHQPGRAAVDDVVLVRKVLLYCYIVATAVATIDVAAAERLQPLCRTSAMTPDP